MSRTAAKAILVALLFALWTGVFWSLGHWPGLLEFVAVFVAGAVLGVAVLAVGVLCAFVFPRESKR